jgi:hypothetical protein
MTNAVNEHSTMLAMKAAHDAGRDDLALMLLSGRCRAYSRTIKSKPGFQIGDWNQPVPDKTMIAVYVDTFGRQPMFYVIPVPALKKIIRKVRRSGNSPRPVTPKSRHCYLTRADLAAFEDAWAAA